MSESANKEKNNDKSKDKDKEKTDEMWEQKLREQQKKTRAEADEEHGEKLKAAERRWLGEQAELKVELEQAKKDAIQLNDALKESQKLSQTQAAGNSFLPSPISPHFPNPL